jgi:hypothetical protein
MGRTAVQAVPNYEVKLFLVADAVLDREARLTRRVREAFKTGRRTKRLRMQFVDDALRQLHAAGWNVRLRAFEGEDGFELTYKRRYPTPGAIAATLAAAAQDGFDAGEADYEAQVEWGHTRRTLSLSNRKHLEVPDQCDQGGGGLRLPNTAAARRVGAAELPGKLDRTVSPGWARAVLARAHAYGPVRGRRWTGECEGSSVDLEVWTLRGAAGADAERVVEVSLHADDRREAASRREGLRHWLREKGWLEERDVLKTELILRRYA